jgi:hypothetical protein
MLEELERKRAELMRELRAIGAAIKAYADAVSQSQPVAVATKTKKVEPNVRKRRKMSAATKKKLSLAAKARWAKVTAKKS